LVSKVEGEKKRRLGKTRRRVLQRIEVKLVSGNSSNFRKNINAPAVMIEEDSAIRHSEKGIIFSSADIFTGVKFGTTLPKNDTASGNFATTKDFKAKALAIRFAPIFYRSLTFFMCHDLILPSKKQYYPTQGRVGKLFYKLPKKF